MVKTFPGTFRKTHKMSGAFLTKIRGENSERLSPKIIKNDLYDLICPPSKWPSYELGFPSPTMNSAKKVCLKLPFLAASHPQLRRIRSSSKSQDLVVGIAPGLRRVRWLDAWPSSGNFQGASLWSPGVRWVGVQQRCCGECTNSMFSVHGIPTSPTQWDG